MRCDDRPLRRVVRPDTSRPSARRPGGRSRPCGWRSCASSPRENSPSRRDVTRPRRRCEPGWWRWRSPANRASRLERVELDRAGTLLHRRYPAGTQATRAREGICHSGRGGRGTGTDRVAGGGRSCRNCRTSSCLPAPARRCRRFPGRSRRCGRRRWISRRPRSASGLRTGRSIRYWVPDAVAEFIIAKGLYFTDA